MQNVELCWSSEKPKKPGWYWYRYKYMLPSEYIISIVDVFTYHHELYCSKGYIHMLEGEWAGPIDPPTERENVRISLSDWAGLADEFNRRTEG